MMWCSLFLAQVTTLESYGPTGVFLATVLGALGFIYRDKVAREKELGEQHAQERTIWTKECREERTELIIQHQAAWNESRTWLKESLTDVSKGVKALEAAIVDLHVTLKTERAQQRKQLEDKS